MKCDLVPIGNSRGVRIPKALIEQTGLSRTVELTVRPEGLLISPARRPREGWAELFAVSSPEKQLLIPDDLANSWDTEGWQWPAD